MCGTSWTDCGPDHARRPAPCVHAKCGRAVPGTVAWGFVSPFGVVVFLRFWFFVANPLLLAWLLRVLVFCLCRYYLDMHVIEMGTPPLVKTAARLFRELCYSNKSQLMAGIICAGWDSAKGGQVRARDCLVVDVSRRELLRASGVWSSRCRLAEDRVCLLPGQLSSSTSLVDAV